MPEDIRKNFAEYIQMNRTSSTREAEEPESTVEVDELQNEAAIEMCRLVQNWSILFQADISRGFDKFVCLLASMDLSDVVETNRQGLHDEVFLLMLEEIDSGKKVTQTFIVACNSFFEQHATSMGVTPGELLTEFESILSETEEKILRSCATTHHLIYNCIGDTQALYSKENRGALAEFLGITRPYLQDKVKKEKAMLIQNIGECLRTIIDQFNIFSMKLDDYLYLYDSIKTELNALRSGLTLEPQEKETLQGKYSKDLFKAIKEHEGYLKALKFLEEGCADLLLLMRSNRIDRTNYPVEKVSIMVLQLKREVEVRINKFRKYLTIILTGEVPGEDKPATLSPNQQEAFKRVQKLKDETMAVKRKIEQTSTTLHVVKCQREEEVRKLITKETEMSKVSKTLNILQARIEKTDKSIEKLEKIKSRAAEKMDQATVKKLKDSIKTLRDIKERERGKVRIAEKQHESINKLYHEITGQIRGFDGVIDELSVETQKGNPKNAR